MTILKTVILFLILSTTIHSREYFSYLKADTLTTPPQSKDTIHLLYSDRVGQRLNKQFYHRATKKPFWHVYTFMVEGDSVLIKFQLDTNNHAIFTVMREVDERRITLGNLSGTLLAVPGTPYLYTREPSKNLHNTFRKFRITKKSLQETPQPFFFSNRSITLSKTIPIYFDTTYTSPVAKLPQKTAATILLAVPGNRHFLIKTPFGLTGWASRSLLKEGGISIDSP